MYITLEVNKLEKSNRYGLETEERRYDQKEEAVGGGICKAVRAQEQVGVKTMMESGTIVETNTNPTSSHMHQSGFSFTWSAVYAFEGLFYY